MAIFKAPRITTLQRLSLVLQASEIVYDLDTKSFWGGNGDTLGGFPIGVGSAEGSFEYITLTEENIQSKSVQLSRAPTSQNHIVVEIIGGITQLYDVDYITTLDVMSWDSLGLDGYLVEGDIILVSFLAFTGGPTGGGYQLIPLTESDIINKFVTLNNTPSTPENVRLEIVGGIQQLYSIDYVVGGNILAWNGLGLDGFLQSDDLLLIQF
jgi:hypothetical protein